ncbi:HAD-IA family hydrolase [Candidatus Woesearchaeota archaeon]|nr:HAD-IA family hydrolase [Candidatus Woesearchaeota archaeon]
MGLRAICFDLDGVLYMPHEFIRTILLHSVRAMITYGLKAEVDVALDKLIEIRNEDTGATDHFNRLCLHFNRQEDPIIIASGVEKYHESKTAYMQRPKGLDYVLSKLKEHYILCLVSNGRPIKQADKAVRLGIVHYFTKFGSDASIRQRMVYISNDPSKMKPMPYLWNACTQDLGVDFSECVMIGDKLWEDMVGAKRLGMKTIKINQGNHALLSIKDSFVKAKKSTAFKRLYPKGLTLKEFTELATPDAQAIDLTELPGLIQNIAADLE